jgi:hypothetical protein
MKSSNAITTPSVFALLRNVVIASFALIVLTGANAQVITNNDSISATDIGGGFGNVLSNDTINGQPPSSLPPVTNTSGPTLSAPMIPGASLDPMGNISIPIGLSAGTYSATYELCDLASNCNIGSITVTVTAATPPAPPPPLADSTSLSRLGGTIDVLTNDGYPPGSVYVKVTNAAGLGITTDVSGNLVVPPGVNSGSYTASYDVCADIALTTCSGTSASVGITITAGPVATADTANGTVGTVLNIPVLSNDTLDGAPATSSNVSIQIVSAMTGLSVVSGQLQVSTIATAGTYSPTYQICYISNSSVCSTPVTVSVTLAASLPTPVAVADTATVTTSGGLVSVMSNDTVNAVPASSSSVLPIIITNGGITGLTVNSAGQIVVPATAAGSYTATYQLCYISSTTTCSTTVNAVITVSATATPIVAKADAVTMNIAPTADVTLNVLSNDTVNGAAISNPSLVTITLTNNAGLTATSLASTGVLTIPKANYTVGVYTLTYQICLVSQPSNCSSASITVTIQSTAVVVGVGGVKIPPSVPGSPSTTTVIRSSNGSPILFSGGTTTAAGAANQPAYFTGVRIGFGYGFGSLVGSTQTVDVNQPQDPPPFNAQVFYSGSGNLKARWEVIQPGDPEPTLLDLQPEEGLTTIQLAQRMRYTFIERVYAYLAPVGSYYVNGPNPKLLPRSRLGTYRVMLRLESTGAGTPSNFLIPLITYRVLSGGKSVTDMSAGTTKQTDSINQANFVPSFFKSNNESPNIPRFSIESVNVSAPNAGHHFAQLEPIVLRWKKAVTSQVDRWQIEVRDSQRRLLTATWVPSDKLEYVLSPVIRVGLPLREELSWRVVGLKSSVEPVASSSWMYFSID